MDFLVNILLDHVVQIAVPHFVAEHRHTLVNVMRKIQKQHVVTELITMLMAMKTVLTLNVLILHIVQQNETIVQILTDDLLVNRTIIY